MIARDLAAQNGYKKRATILVLSGALGTGKTTFVRLLAERLGVSGRVLSPTFVFAHEHPILKRFPFRKLVHIDAYRIDSQKIFRSTGISHYFKDLANLVVVEWGEKIRRWIPQPDLVIRLRHHSPRTRKIQIVKFHAPQRK